MHNARSLRQREMVRNAGRREPGQVRHLQRGRCGDLLLLHVLEDVVLPSGHGGPGSDHDLLQASPCRLESTEVPNRMPKCK